jgi:hypothetical protein
MILLELQCLRVVVLTVLLFPFASGFIPRSSRAFTPIVTQPQKHHHANLNTPTSTTRLSMGLFEDFLKGQDSSKREEDNKKYLETLQKRVEKINALEPTIEDLGDDELEAKTEEFKQRLVNGEDLNGELLEEAFAVVREAAW